MQLTMATLMPTIFLSGYIFPIDSMPLVFRWLSLAIPTSWMIDASRGVILRGAGWAELWPHAVVLWLMALAVLALSMMKFRKQLT
jgi:ABC-2 type transport system permease protein